MSIFPHFDLAHKRPKQIIHKTDLVFIDGMPHVGVDTLCDRSAHLPEYRGTLDYSIDRNMEVHITATEEHRGPVQCAWICAWCV